MGELVHHVHLYVLRYNGMPERMFEANGRAAMLRRPTQPAPCDK